MLPVLQWCYPIKLIALVQCHITNRHITLTICFPLISFHAPVPRPHNLSAHQSCSCSASTSHRIRPSSQAKVGGKRIRSSADIALYHSYLSESPTPSLQPHNLPSHPLRPHPQTPTNIQRPRQPLYPLLPLFRLLHIHILALPTSYDVLLAHDQFAVGMHVERDAERCV